MTTSNEHTLTPIIQPDGRFTITVTQQEFDEICYALRVLEKKRESAREFQRKKYEKETAGRATGEKRSYRKAINLVITKPNPQ